MPLNTTGSPPVASIFGDLGSSSANAESSSSFNSLPSSSNLGVFDPSSFSVSSFTTRFTPSQHQRHDSLPTQHGVVEEDPEAIHDSQIHLDPPSALLSLQSADGEAPDDCFLDVQPQQSKYELRPGARRGTEIAGCSTWVDQDQSGTYDPFAREYINRKKRKTADSAPGKESDGNEAPDTVKRAKPTSLAMARKTGYDLVITFQLTSSDGKKWLLEHEGEDNWPEGDHHSLHKPEGVGAASSSLSKRSCRNKTECTIIPDPLGEQENLSGHPAVRGCVRCRAKNKQCPLAHDWGDKQWPCEDCVADGVDCDLLRPPAMKQACEACKRLGEECSYTCDNPGYSEDCDHCMVTGTRCVAGPLPGSVMHRISYDRYASSGQLPPQQPPALLYRKYIHCTACRLEKRYCSLKKFTDMAPCNLCIKRGIPCTFEDIKGKGPAKEAAKPLPKESKQEKKSADLQDEVVILQDIGGHRGPVVSLRTNFCHPIWFGNADEILGGRHSCQFCIAPGFALLGCGELRDVDVIEWETGFGYTELFCGYAAEGFPHTVLCQQCTEARAKKIMCSHIINPLPWADQMKDQAFRDKALGRLLEGNGQSTDVFCDICVSAASHKCCNNTADVLGVTSDDPQRGGCGLHLCRKCAGELSSSFAGDFDAFVSSKEAKYQSREDRDVRADISFLRVGGLLLRNYLASI